MKIKDRELLVDMLKALDMTNTYIALIDNPVDVDRNGNEIKAVIIQCKANFDTNLLKEMALLHGVEIAKECISEMMIEELASEIMDLSPNEIYILDVEPYEFDKIYVGYKFRGVIKTV